MLKLIVANPIEWTTLAIAFVSLIFSAMTWRDAIKDQAFLLATGKDGLNQLSADSNIRQEQYRLWMAGVMVLVSAAALPLPPPPPDYSTLPQSIVMMFGWMFLAAINTWASINDRSERRLVRKYYDAPNPTDPTTGAPADANLPPDNNPTHAGSIGARIKKHLRRDTD
jgi:hypothetical protein